MVDPPTGRVPIMPWAEEQRDLKLAHIQDDWENHTPWERCITRGVPGGLFPAGYGSGYQILQGPGYVSIVYEMMHEARVIPLDGRPHINAKIKSYMGDSRGRWEGDTLVVETTNTNGKVGLTRNGNTTPTSEQLRIVERFTRVAPDRLEYEATIEDPVIWTRPWTVSLPFRLQPDYGMYEYACHEGNYGMRNILSGARQEERAK